MDVFKVEYKKVIRLFFSVLTVFVKKCYIVFFKAFKNKIVENVFLAMEDFGKYKVKYYVPVYISMQKSSAAAKDDKFIKTRITELWPFRGAHWGGGGEGGKV